MQLHFVDRQTYRLKHEHDYLEQLRLQHGDFYLIPEGGSNHLAVKGCRDWLHNIDEEFDLITCACGTGATLAGFIEALKPQQNALGFAVLKNADFLNTDIANLIDVEDNWSINLDYHFGGYAKTSNGLFEFMHWFKQQFDIELDAVYTAKMFYGLFELIRSGHFKPGTHILAVHTGGLQGNDGFRMKITNNR